MYTATETILYVNLPDSCCISKCFKNQPENEKKLRQLSTI